MAIKTDTYEVNIIGDWPDDAGNANIDVELSFQATGERFGATFFTISNIKELMDRYTKTGECRNGSYFWAADLILVRRITERDIAECIDSLIAEGEFRQAMRHLKP